MGARVPIDFPCREEADVYPEAILGEASSSLGNTPSLDESGHSDSLPRTRLAPGVKYPMTHGMLASGPCSDGHGRESGRGGRTTGRECQSGNLRQSRGG